MPYRNPDLQAAASRDYKRLRTEAVAKLKEEPCVECGGRFPTECMQWDHRPGETKFRPISTMSNYSWARILAEIAKCDLVCANCHAIRTRARITLKPPYAKPERVPRVARTKKPRVLKMYCIHGHLYDAANTYTYHGKRHCRACNRLTIQRRDRARRLVVE